MNRTIGLVDTNYTVPDFAELAQRRPAANMPFAARYRLMDFPLSNMVNSRISTVGLITPYYYRSILDHVGAGKEWGLDRKEGGLFVLPGSAFGLRDADSRFLLRDLAHNQRFLALDRADYVLSSDCSMIYNADYQPMITEHELAGRPVTLLYKETEPGERRRGYYLSLDERGLVTDITQAQSGRYLFLNCFLADRTFLLRFLRDFHALNHMGFIDVLRQNLDLIRTGSFAFNGYVGVVDGVADYMRVNQDLLRDDVRRQLLPPDRQIYTKLHDSPPAIYAPGALVRGSLLSAGCIVEGTVENSIIFRQTRVEKGAVVRNCVIMEHGVIRTGAQLDWCVCDKGAVFNEGVAVRGSAEHPCIIPKGKII